VSVIWTREATALRCPWCKASPGSRCRTSSGAQASAPHLGRLVPSYTCPRCQLVTVEPTNVRSGYCTGCRDWTWDRDGVRAAQDELAL